MNLTNQRPVLGKVYNKRSRVYNKQLGCICGEIGVYNDLK
jgi:hypothetical protein